MALLTALLLAVLYPTVLRAAPADNATGGADGLPRLYSYEIVRELPHDPAAFTQGLEYGERDGRPVFWESTGLYGKSQLREVDVETGAVLRSVPLPRHLFGEGLARVGDRLLQLTWRRGTLLDFDVSTLDAADVAAATGVRLRDTGLQDGWGAAFDGGSLVVTDSSTTLRWLDAESLEVRRRETVTDGGQAVPWVNELEWIDGEIWGNVWQTPCIARVDPATGRVSGWVLMSGLTERTRVENDRLGARMDVLNGVAYDAAGGRLFVTGKLWAKLYEVRIVPTESSAEAVAAARRLCIPSAAAARGL